ncbi:MAG: hypothetical protein MK193_07150 [Lentisphaeria bacterium]|nr:hypothetical protein [Lentisphaeria bacterium]
MMMRTIPLNKSLNSKVISKLLTAENFLNADESDWGEEEEDWDEESDDSWSEEDEESDDSWTEDMDWDEEDNNWNDDSEDDWDIPDSWKPETNPRWDDDGEEY